MVPNESYWDPARTPTNRPRRADPAAEAKRPHRGAAVGPGGLDRGALARRDPADRVAPASRSTPTPSRTCGRGSCPSRRLALARPARAPRREPCASTARSSRSCSAATWPSPSARSRPGHPWWGDPSFEISLRSGVAARALMEEAGFSADNPVQVKVQTSASGGGLWPDAADPDERVRPAVAAGIAYFDGRARRDRVEHAVHQLAARRDRPDGERRACDQRLLRGDGPVLSP